MKIAILSRGEGLYSTQRLLKAAEARNHLVEVLDPVLCDLSVEHNIAILRYQGEVVSDIQAVIPRIGASNTYFGASLVRHFEAMKVFTVVNANAILRSRDKWTCTQILAKAKIPIPKTVYASFLNYEQQLQEFKGNPVIIKLLEGTHGHGVVLAENYQAALATIEMLETAGLKFLIQEYIAESKGADIRAIVVDGVVVASMKRQSKEGDFRSNLHRGGSSESIKLDYKEESIAIQAAKALRLGVCGVDILQSNRGPLVLEVNSTPGLEGIERATGKNVAKSIIGYAERNKP